MTASSTTAPPETQAVGIEAFNALATLHQLSLEAGMSEGVEQLTFCMLNRSVSFCRYDRAVLWNLDGAHPRLLGVSGNTDLNTRSPLVEQWQRLVTDLSQAQRPGLLDRTSFRNQAEIWDEVSQRSGGLSVAWLPINLDDHTVAGLWFERWGGQEFSSDQLASLQTLVQSYAIAWRAIVPRRRRITALIRTRKRRTAMILAGALLTAMTLIRLPLRIVAPCEVIPGDPVLIAAPLNGVIDEVLVLPGRAVAEGDLLAVYDRQVAEEEVEVARQQVQIIESDLQRSRVSAFDDANARTVIALLENRLQQEKARLQLAEYHLSQLEVRAPVGGTVILDDPYQWRGQPVQVGQRLMMIVDPNDTRVRAWLPESDNIPFDEDRPVRIVLDSDPGRRRTARLDFVAGHSELTPTGLTAFRAEAEWQDAQSNLKLGLKGTAVLYGPRTSLGYWLFRRPLAAVRRYLGR